MPDPADERALFARLLSPDWVNAVDPAGAAAAYTPAVVTWLLVYPRLHAGAPVADAVAEFLAGWLQGKIAYVRMVRPEVGERLQAELLRLLGPSAER